ncbi:hypothetical protein GPALN_006623 [Globodera pallida]|nr:hypothetical protein GPALN_006623 [Globodera pallida]
MTKSVLLTMIASDGSGTSSEVTLRGRMRASFLRTSWPQIELTRKAKLNMDALFKDVFGEQYAAAQLCCPAFSPAPTIWRQCSPFYCSESFFIPQIRVIL